MIHDSSKWNGKVDEPTFKKINMKTKGLHDFIIKSVWTLFSSEYAVITWALLISGTIAYTLSH